ncbi:Hypothetical protein SMAX5B_003092 [Scophthalmus maximus]|uniref:Uncharacterized protein n=1 Tax=Scophthalmus maximus TaxID=52904 RepID=A0A2U9BN90_SCOMX|nr:Hypothetical protein SMAX5B_003092 [Scophthalmus maximus]
MGSYEQMLPGEDHVSETSDGTPAEHRPARRRGVICSFVTGHTGEYFTMSPAKVDLHRRFRARVVTTTSGTRRRQD